MSFHVIAIMAKAGWERFESCVMKKKIGLGVFGLIIIAILAVLIWPENPHEYYQVDAAYQAQVDAYHVPPMPADWTWQEFEAKDGTKLRSGQTGNSGAAKASVIIVPGYTATLSMYGEHVDYLAEQGYHVMGLDLRGQGGSERYRKDQPEKLWIDDFSSYSDDLAAFIAAQNLPEDRAVVPIAISFGGHVAARMATEHQGLADGLMLLAPAFVPKAGEYSFDDALRMMQTARKLGKAKRYTIGGTNWKPVGEDFTQANIDMCSSEPKRLYLRDVVFTREPHQRVGAVTNQWGAEFFESSQLMMSGEYFSDLQIPVSIISAEQDDFVDTAANQRVCSEQISDCSEIQIPGTGHCLMQEHDEDLAIVFAQINLLIAKILDKK